MAVTIEKIDAVLKETERFMTFAREARCRLIVDKDADYGCKETGAVRRASMDLSRLLVSLRK
jgi:hypothetical protein